MINDFLKRKMGNIFGWEIKEGKINPPDFDFPDFVWKRINMAASEYENGLTFIGALNAVLSFDEEKSKKEWQLGACTDWIPVTEEFVEWRDKQPDVSMELAVALIYGPSQSEPEMTIFEITNPYIAVIVARDEEDCWEFYKDNVADTDDKEYFISDLKVIKASDVIKRLTKLINEDTGKPIGSSEAAAQVRNALEDKQPTLLMIDGSLV